MASVSEVVESLPHGESSGLDGVYDARQGSFGSSGVLSRCRCSPFWKVAGRWPRFAGVVEP